MLPNNLFFTGAPGSRWSGISQILESSGKFNISDRSINRQYTHSQYSGHEGAYFGKQMEFEPILELEYLNLPWAKQSILPKIYKSHDWAYNLEEVSEFALRTNSWLLLVYRETRKCYDWWHAAGGFSIAYPNYTWYKDSDNMRKQIAIQNSNILQFVAKRQLEFQQFGAEWCAKEFGVSVTVDSEKYSDIMVAIQK